MNELQLKPTATTLPKVNRELSWLAFDERVLLEALDYHVPLIERLRFLGIYSNNLDEFFRVRVGTLNRIIESEDQNKSLLSYDPKEVMKEIYKELKKNESIVMRAYENIKKELKTKGIHIVNEHELSPELVEWCRDYFKKNIRIAITPLLFKEGLKFPQLRDKSIYLAIKMVMKNDENVYSLIEVPTDFFPRFIEVPHPIADNHFVMYMDDLIRLNLDEIYKVFDFKEIGAYTIKITRDAELDMDSDFSKSDVEHLSAILKQRKIGTPVRFIADRHIPKDLLDYLLKRTKTSPESVVLSSKYHNFKDLMNFPDFGIKGLKYKYEEHIPNKSIERSETMLYTIEKKDILLFYPYHSFDYLLDFLREASIDPHVEEIKMSLYRLSRKSQIVNILNTAVKNGKKVTVVMEITARFDEENNIFWAQKMEEEGINVIYGHPKLKVHSKLVYIRKVQDGTVTEYCNISTGNFNEVTADLYSDMSLFTKNEKLAGEVREVFNSITYYTEYDFKYLWVAPYNLREQLIQKIQQEIDNKKRGKRAKIIFKVNSLVDDEVIDKLYEAQEAGVKIKMIVRGICCLPIVPPNKKQLYAVSIIDKFLEHSRVFYFYNNGEHDCYISSADIMIRNLDYRIEVATPIFDKSLVKQILKFLKIQLSDDTKARMQDVKMDNRKVKKNLLTKPVRSQVAIYNWLKKI